MVLKAAAFIGIEFDLNLVITVSGLTDPNPIQDLQSAFMTGLIIRSEMRGQFVHDKVHDVAAVVLAEAAVLLHGLVEGLGEKT